MPLVTHHLFRSRRGIQISKKSLQQLIAKLTEAVSDMAPTDRYLSVRRVLARYPGEKPWGECVELLISGKTKFYFGADRFSIRDIRVDPTDLPTLRVVSSAVESDPTAIERIPLRDAYEVLGAPEEEAKASLRSAKVEIFVEGRGKSVCRRELQGLVAMIAFASEVASPDSASSIAIFHRLSRLKIPRVHGAWSRSHLVMRGMVKPMVASRTDQQGSTAQSG